MEVCVLAGQGQEPSSCPGLQPSLPHSLTPLPAGQMPGSLGSIGEG